MQQTYRILLITAVLVIAVVAGMSNLLTSSSSSTPMIVTAAQSNATQPAAVLQPATSDNTFTQIYYDVSPSVVAISVSVVSRNRVVASGTGSGFVVDDAGYCDQRSCGRWRFADRG